MNNKLVKKLCNKINIIAFTGLATSGKDTVSSILKSRIEVDEVFNFAFDVKKIAVEQFGWDGKKDEKGRILLHNVGTTTGRAYSPDIWVDKFLKRLNIFYEHNKKKENLLVFINDLRFDNEANLVKKFGGIIINVINPYVKQLKISSEKGINPNYIDYNIYNENLGDNFKSINSKVDELLLTQLNKYLTSINR